MNGQYLFRENNIGVNEVDCKACEPTLMLIYDVPLPVSSVFLLSYTCINWYFWPVGVKL